MTEETKTSREFLGSRLGFILLSAGCAIGLGNIWRFPYITGQYGGALFGCFYLLFLVLLGFPVLVMELAICLAIVNISKMAMVCDNDVSLTRVITSFVTAGNMCFTT